MLLGDTSDKICWALTVALFVLALPARAASAADNPIVIENRKTGNPPSEWDVSGSGDPSIQGFATDISYNRGQSVTFKVQTTAAAFRIDIYRLGYYAGRGARKLATFNGTRRGQPNCRTDATTGLIDCGNWKNSGSWLIPAAATSGIYFAKLVRTDTRGGVTSFLSFDMTAATPMCSFRPRTPPGRPIMIMVGTACTWANLRGAPTK
jgi:N,N-dimethylformamidase beta subunit-like, C-terminal